MPRLAFAIAAACALSTPATATEWPVCHGGNRPLATSPVSLKVIRGGGTA